MGRREGLNADPHIHDVSKILDSSGLGRHTRYLVQWTGFEDPEHNTWHKKEDLVNCEAAFKEFKKRKDAERHRRYYNSQHITKAEAKRVLTLCGGRAERLKSAKSDIERIEKMR